ncbi:hypothetical protein ASG47_10070 [Devosia sp. Leaf420]|uniref:LysR family transcriptional regulator n=1 Tax=Devosia sp. Leaf420 TaxID=1736374 RepID=UPI00071382A5|nr:LysR family transcriptional regulator [Devosia sp. Leaf420]KQT46944.1 hypothetical protein ASG47_10070 [Devosia sp. Leaf420]
MDLWALRVLDAVVTAGTISGAAEIVRRTQPQISRIVRDLEAKLGFELFFRIGRRLSPTPNCLVYLEESRDILDRVAALDITARQLRAQQQPDLHIVAPPYAFHGLLPPVVAQLRAEMPNVPLTVSGLHRQDDGKWMMPSGFNVGLAVLPFDLPEVIQQSVGTFGAAVILPRGHALSGRAVLTVRDIDQHPFVALRQAAPLRRQLDRLFEAEGIRPNIAMTVPDSTSALRMVMEGVGLTVGDIFSARSIGGAQVEIIRFEGLQPGQLGVFWPNTSASHPARTRFLEICTELLARQ